jgi:hypothetical protein
VWNGEAIPPASGVRQLHRLLDGLAKLPDAPRPSLADLLASPACRGFRDGLQVVVTTDAALAAVGRSCAAEEQRRWLVLRAAAFDPSPDAAGTPAVRLPVRPWLWVDAVGNIPALLRGGWREARHGS